MQERFMRGVIYYGECTEMGDEQSVSWVKSSITVFKFKVSNSRLLCSNAIRNP